jgi:hypothetical protein
MIGSGEGLKKGSSRVSEGGRLTHWLSPSLPIETRRGYMTALTWLAREAIHIYPKLSCIIIEDRLGRVALFEEA